MSLGRCLGQACRLNRRDWDRRVVWMVSGTSVSLGRCLGQACRLNRRDWDRRVVWTVSGTGVSFEQA